MRNAPTVILALSLALVLVGFIAGWHLALQQIPATVLSQSVATATPTVERAPSPAREESRPLPAVDVAGEDIPDLPRYPGAVRMVFEQQTEGDLITTRLAYRTASDRDTVRTFYRLVFHDQGWIVADVRFVRARWTFFVVNRAREAVLDIDPVNGHTTIFMELSEPRISSVRAPLATLQPAEAPPATTPPVPDDPEPGDDALWAAVESPPSARPAIVTRSLPLPVLAAHDDEPSEEGHVAMDRDDGAMVPEEGAEDEAKEGMDAITVVEMYDTDIIPVIRPTRAPEPEPDMVMVAEPGIAAESMTEGDEGSAESADDLEAAEEMEDAG